MNEDVKKYNDAQPEGLKQVCQLLAEEINKALPEATSKLYHASPVWFINDNPITGYWAPKKGVGLLFWSGQSFATPGLKPIGKHKAAGITFKSVDEIDLGLIKEWLDESRQVQWDYANIRKNNGKLTLLKWDR